MSVKDGYKFEDLSVGMSHETTHVITEEDVLLFAKVSGDHNPIHVDEEYAKKTPFGQRIAHGALTASYISGILGNDLDRDVRSKRLDETRDHRKMWRWADLSPQRPKCPEVGPIGERSWQGDPPITFRTVPCAKESRNSFTSLPPCLSRLPTSS